MHVRVGFIMVVGGTYLYTCICGLICSCGCMCVGIYVCVYLLFSVCI